MIYNLQTLRGLLAVSVFATHFGFSNIFIHAGNFRIAGFMMLSGFVFTLSNLRRVETGKVPPPSKFIWNRIAHLYPLYFVALLITLFIEGFSIGKGPAIADFLMVQSWNFANPNYYFSGNPPTWFNSSIMFCYMVYIPLFCLSVRRPKLFFGLFALYLAAYFCMAFMVPEPVVFGIVYVFPPMQFATFMWGVVIAIFYHHRPFTIQTPWLADLLIVAVVALKTGLLFLTPYITERIGLASLWWPSTITLLLVLTATDKTKCLITRIFHWKPLVVFGDISFSFYILHYPWMIGLRKIMNHFDIQLPLMVEFLLMVPLLAVVAYYIRHHFELPICNKLLSLQKNRGK